jgi:hypothetical protein
LETQKGFTIPDFKLYYRALSNKDSMVLAQNRQVDQWNRIVDTEISPHSYSHLIFDKDIKNLIVEKTVSSNKWYWKNWASMFRRLKLDSLNNKGTKYQNQKKTYKMGEKSLPVFLR